MAMEVEPGILVKKILEHIDEIKKLVKDAVIDKAEFLMLAYFVAELQPLMECLMQHQDSDILALQRPALTRIAGVLESAISFTERCVTGSRIYLLYHCNELVERIRKIIAELKASLLLFSPAVSDDFTIIVNDVRNNLDGALFRREPGHETLSEAIAAGLNCKIVDEAHATTLLREIASHLQVPLSAAGVLKTELQEALDRAEAERRLDEVQDLRNLCDLFEPAVVPGDVRKLAAEESSFHQPGSAGSIPSAFFCPITGQIMQDPVMVVEVGYTYEKAAILEWFQRGHSTCPDTGKELESLEILENRTLRQAIEEYFDRLAKEKLEEAVQTLLQGADELSQEDFDVPIAEIKKHIDANAQYKQYFVKLHGLEALVKVLKPAPQAIRDRALRILSQVSAGKDDLKVRLVAAGVVPLLVRLLTKTPTQTFGVMQLLWELSQVDPGKKAILDVKGSIFPIASAFSQCTLDQKDMAEKLLDNLCEKNPDVVLDLAKASVFKPLVAHMSSGYETEIRVLMSRAVIDLKLTEPNSYKLVNAGAIPPLLDLMLIQDTHAQVAALKALRHLTEHEKNRGVVANVGAIPILVNSLAFDVRKVRVEALGTLANLAADREGALAIDHEDHATTRLFAMVKCEDPVVQELAMKTLVCIAKESRAIRSAMRNSPNVPYLLTFLQRQDTASACRASILSTLCYLVEDTACRDCVVASSQLLKFLTSLLEKPTRIEEKQSILRIMAGIAELPDSKALMVQDGSLLSTLVKCLEPGSGLGNDRIQECAAETISKLVDMTPVDTNIQLMLSRLGMMPFLVNLVNSKNDKTAHFAAITLGILSRSTPQLIVQQSVSKRLLANIGMQRYRSCKVHAGRCSQKGTLCIVDAGAVPNLVKLMKEGSHRSAESAIDALLTLVNIRECKERAVDFLMKHNIMGAAVVLVGRNPSSTEKGVCMLEQILSMKKYQDEKYSIVAKNRLCETMTGGTLEAKKAAAKALAHLGIMPKSSSTYSTIDSVGG